MKSDQLEKASGLLPAELLPSSGFLSEASPYPSEPLQDLILRVNAGSRSRMGVPSDLVWRWAALAGRLAPELQTFIAQVLRGTGNLDHFLVRPAALDHHAYDHGLLEASILAAELALNADHRPERWDILPREVDDLEQVCATVAFLFDIGKVFEPALGFDRPRLAARTLPPYADLPRCWREAWRDLHHRNPVLAAWLHHVGRASARTTSAVRATQHLVRTAVGAAWMRDE